MIRASSIDIGGLINAGVGILRNTVFKPKTTGPVAATQTANDYTPVKNSMPAWLIPVAIVGALLLFRKKIFK